MDGLSASRPLSYQDLIAQQGQRQSAASSPQSATSTGAQRPSFAADLYDPKTVKGVSGKVFEAEHARGDASSHQQRFARAERFAGQMPEWAPDQHVSPSQYVQNFAGMTTQEDVDLDALIERRDPLRHNPAEGGLARKYVRDTNPEYADVTIGDFVDMVNPLHHLPIVGSIYREITGDEIKPPARIMGGGIFGGPVGMASAMVNSIVEDQTGEDITGNVASMMRGPKVGQGAERLSFASQDTFSDSSAQFTQVSDAGRPMSFAEAKAYYSAQTPQNRAEVDGASHNRFFEDRAEQKELSMDDLLASSPSATIEQGHNGNPTPSALSFGPNVGGEVAQATKDHFGDRRTAGHMPEFSAKTFGLKEKSALSEELRMDNPTAREPVSRVRFE